MELCPEEKRRIYEEEKARIEAREQIRRDRQKRSQETSTGLEPNIAGLLCYIGGWVSGIIFFVLEQKNSWVRFHAAQSIVVFSVITVAGVLLGLIPLIGHTFASIIALIGFILWIFLMLKAYHGERFRVAWAGDIADRMLTPLDLTVEYQESPAPEPIGATALSDGDLETRIDRRVSAYFERRRAGRVTASAFAIAWSIALLVFFNFFSGYVAYYHAETSGGAVTWTRSPFFTAEISLWLPVLTTTLVISILGHIVLIIFDRYILRQIIRIVIDVFGLAMVVTLLTVFPFDFSAVPDAMIAGGVSVGVTVVLICISAGIGIGILVRLIKLIVNIARGTAFSRES